jgi:hypothetical protein
MNSADPTRNPVAYKDEEFLDSDEGRPLRILAEYLEPLYAFQRQNICDTIVFFGSARITPDGPLGEYYEAARELARLVTAWSESLPSNAHRYVVCTGGGPGIMEAANRGATEAGGRPSASTSGCRASNCRIPISRGSSRSSSTTFSCASCGSPISRVHSSSFPAATARSTRCARS